MLLFQNLSPATIIIFLIALVVAITIHEFSHAFMAYRLGDPTAKVHGRMTLNPLAHLDPIGTIMILFVGFGWGKPVPFDPFNLRNPKRDSALISLAGPLSNVLLALFLVGLFWIGIFARIPTLLTISQIIQPIVFLNLVLAIFNLLPIHPLDGFKILGGILPKEWYYDWMQMERYGIFFLIFLILPILPQGGSIIGVILGPVLRSITNFLYFGP
jgi:Zn-dependent protease